LIESGSMSGADLSLKDSYVRAYHQLLSLVE
jgi:hypothetical protein